MTTNNNWKAGYFSVFFLVCGALVFLLFLHYDQNKRDYMTKISNDLKMQVSGVIESHQSLSDSFYYHNEAQIAQLLYEAVHRPETMDTIRSRLYYEFVRHYNVQTLSGWRQLHVHLPHAISFLRFHAPKEYGDSLYELRQSLKQINRDYRFVRGYEIGRYFDGYHFIYPLFYQGEYVGSMEWGQSMFQLMNDVKRLFGDDAFFIIRSDALEQRMNPTYLEGFYEPIEEMPLYSVFSSIKDDPKVKQYMQQIFGNAQEFASRIRLDGFDALLIQKDEKDHLVVLTPFPQIGGERSAFMISIRKDEMLGSFYTDFLIQSVLAIMLIALVMYRMYVSSEEKKQMMMLLHRQNDMVILTNGDDMIAANQTLLDYFGFSEFQQFKKEHQCICDYFIREKGYLQSKMGQYNWLRHINENQNVSHYAKIQHDAHDDVFLVKSNRVHDGLYSVSLTNVNRLIRESEELEKRATHDVLTGLYNRRRFEENLRHEIRRFERYKTPFTVIMFDIDFFKQINDSFGHDVGDVVLRQLTNLVATMIRDSDILHRWGGEEFMLLQPSTKYPEAKKVCMRIMDVIREHTFHNGIRLTCSFGMVSVVNFMSEKEIFKAVDSALYRAKSGGRDRIEVSNLDA